MTERFKKIKGRETEKKKKSGMIKAIKKKQLLIHSSVNGKCESIPSKTGNKGSQIIGHIFQ